MARSHAYRPRIPMVRRIHVSGLEHQRDRAVVHERDLHVGAEPAGRDRHAERGQRRARTRRPAARPPRAGPPRPSSAAGPARVAVERELAHDERARRRCRAASGSSPRRRRRTRAGSRPWPRASRATASSSSCVTPTSTHKPAPISPTTSPSTVTRAAVTRWIKRPHRAALRRSLLGGGACTSPSAPGRSCPRGAGTRPGRAPMFASSPFHAFSAAACSARPYENESCHGCGPICVDRVEVRGRFLVALAAGQEHDAGHRGGHDLAEARDRRVGDRLGRRRVRPRYFLPGITMFGFSNMPSSSTRCAIQLVEHRCSSVAVVTSSSARSSGRRPSALRARRSGRCPRPGTARRSAPSACAFTSRQYCDGMPRADVDHRAPLREPAPSPRYSTSRSRRPSRPSVTSSSGDFGELRRALVDLDAGDDPLLLEDLRRAGGRRTRSGGSSRRTGSRR